MYKYRNNNPKIKLIVKAISHDKKSLENVENGYIQEYSEKYGNKLINIKSNPLKKPKKVQFEVKIEKQSELEQRIALLNDKIKIKDDVKKEYFFFDTKIDGKRHASIARYKNCSKEQALENVNLTKQNKIKELTLYFN